MLKETTDTKIGQLQRGDLFTLFGLDEFRVVSVLPGGGDFVRLVAIQVDGRGNLAVKIDKNLYVSRIIS